MATVTGITADRAFEILDGTIVSASIEDTALIFTRQDGSTFSAGDFTTYINSQITSQLSTAVNASVASAVPPAVAGGVTAKGDLTGAVDFKAQTAAQIVNRIYTARLIGNITINASTAFPAGMLPGTQFAMRLQQDGTGGRTLTLTGIKASLGSLTLSNAANAIDIIVFMYDGTNWYAGPMGVAFS